MLCDSFLQALERKKEELRHVHEENMRINAESIRTKVQRREEEKLLDMRDLEYLKKKLVSGKQNPPGNDPGVKDGVLLCRSERRNTRRSKNE